MSGDLGNAALVVVNWNCADDIASLSATLPRAWKNDLIVIDNNSANWASQGQKLLSSGLTTVVRRASNDGYAAGVNAGMNKARAMGKSKVVLVNPDARPEPDDISHLLDLARLGGDAIVGIAQTGPEGKYVTAARGVHAFSKAFSCDGCAVGHHRVDVVSGAVLVIDLAVADSLDGFDESFFHYCEEVDFCLRTRQAGYTIIWCCDRVVSHAVGASMPRDSAASHYYMARNKLLLVRKHDKKWWRDLRVAKDQATLAGRAIRNGRGAAWLAGFLDGLRGTRGKWSK